MTEHIDQISLDTDLRYRFEYLSKVFEFTEEDIKVLNELSPFIQPTIPVIVDKVYRKLFSFDITKQHICHCSHFTHKCPSKTNSSSFETNETVEFRKNMLSKYLKIILTQQDWNDAFLRYLSCVGQMHTNQLGNPSIHIDYIHLMALIGFIEQILIEIIWKIEAIDIQTKYRAIFAFNKFFWIQNDFFRKHF